MTDVRRVLLVVPYAGARWRSILAYGSSLRDMLSAAGIEVETVSAPWFNPPSVASAVLQRWSRQPGVLDAEAGAFDLVHVTDNALAHHIPRFIQRSPVVVTAHDLMPFTEPGYYASKPEALVKRAFLGRPRSRLRLANVVMAVSQYTARQLEGVIPDSLPVHLVPNSVRDPFHPRSDAAQALASAGFAPAARQAVVSVGNDRAYKNLDALFEALARPPLAQFGLARAGVGLPRRTLRQARALGLEHRLVEFGALSDDLLAALYSSGAVLAHPSLAEGFGIPVIEAMACGLPVVTSDGGALPEVVGEAGVVVPLAPPNFAARFGEGILQAVARSEELRAAGLERARGFRPAEVVPKLLNAYQDAIDRFNDAS